MKSRHVLLPLALIAALFAGTFSPANAAAPNPVASVTVDSQTQGANETWTLAASWLSAPNADSYRVAIADHADGSITPGSYYASKNTTALAATLSTDNLIAGQTYWISVRALTGSEDSAVTTASFTAIALDTTGPVGTYTIDKTKAYLIGDDFEESEDAPVKITQTSLSDDTTAAATISRKVLPGDGTTPLTWTGSGTFTVHYSRIGNFVPKVQLTDTYGNVTVVTLSAVQVREDTVGPTTKITIPANPGQIASWRHVKGTTTDVGTGVDVTLAILLEKRHGIWYVYDFHTKKFHKGFATLRKTFQKVRVRSAVMRANPAGTWQTPVVKGLTKGLLHIETFAYDKAFNGGLGPIINKQIH